MNALKVLPPEVQFRILAPKIQLVLSNTLLSLSSQIGRFGCVKSLMLSNNAIFELPLEISGMTSLEELEMDNNMLVELPESFGDIGPSLLHLSAKNNKLQYLCENIGRLGGLKSLWLQNNALRDLPQR